MEDIPADIYMGIDLSSQKDIQVWSAFSEGRLLFFAYSEESFISLCNEYGINLKDAPYEDVAHTISLAEWRKQQLRHPSFTGRGTFSISGE